MKKLFLAVVMLSLLLAGCGGEEAAVDSGAAAQAEAQAQAEPARLIASKDFKNVEGNLFLPVFDEYTAEERRVNGLPLTLPSALPAEEKIACLTFDDGPDTVNTPAVLDILKENGVIATFYVTGAHAEANPNVVKRIYAEGHAIGNHSYDHDYTKLYVSPETFLSQIEWTDDVIKSIIGVRPLIVRAPGGTVGNFNAAYFSTMRGNGYAWHDWNVSSADAAPGHPVAQDFIDNIDGQTQGPNAPTCAIILMHSSEGHEETVKALPEIIRILKERGYKFAPVTPVTPRPW